MKRGGLRSVMPLHHRSYPQTTATGSRWGAEQEGGGGAVQGREGQKGGREGQGKAFPSSPHLTYHTPAPLPLRLRWRSCISPHPYRYLTLYISIDTPHPPPPSQVAQLYLTRPLLLEGRKSHLRLWLLVVSHPSPSCGAHRSIDPPHRVYLHDRGLVLFSSETYKPSCPCVGAAGVLAPGHVTNLARNSR